MEEERRDREGERKETAEGRRQRGKEREGRRVGGRKERKGGNGQAEMLLVQRIYFRFNVWLYDFLQ